MTDETYTALLLVIDRSGSMAAIRDDMVGGLTELLRKQAAEPGRMTVDTVIFDDLIETTHVLDDPATVEVVLEPRGVTALHDALGSSIVAFGGRLAAMPEERRPGTVLVVVATDGMENASHEYTAAAVRRLVDEQRDSYGWDFVFLGANQDAVTTGGALGFARDSSIDFDADADGARAVTASASAYISRRKRGVDAAFTSAERGSSKR
jgi:Mg-chelatase subunit ChlD